MSPIRSQVNSRRARRAVACLLLASLACGTPTEVGPPETDWSLITAEFGEIVEGEVPRLTITNGTDRVVHHGGLSARIDIWNGHPWGVYTGGGEPHMLAKAEIITLFPGQTRTFDVDVFEPFAAGEQRFRMGFFTQGSATDAAHGGIETGLLRVRPAAP